MTKTLYILTNTVQKDQDDCSNYILPHQKKRSHVSTYVFIQDGLKQQDTIGDVMYGLQDEENLMSSKKRILESISYHDLLGLIFHSDNVVVT